MNTMYIGQVKIYNIVILNYAVQSIGQQNGQ